MTTFQFTALAFFGLVVLATYRTKILAAVRSLLRRVPAVPAPVTPTQKPAALNLVQDLVTVNDLRERLNAAGCTDGVDACTILLRVLIEFNYQK